ncbi:MAG: hypothetical protein K2G87_05480 [Oscillospiraceae bacterium]|nr:hypothetical protein [Oscillospiraceae bacterium]
MDKNFSILKFLSQVFMIYGITTGLLNVFCILFGTSAYGLSTIFSLGNAGIGVATSFQFLLAVSVIVGLRSVFMTDILIKKMSLAARIIAMFAGAFATILVFIFAFDWFPADMPIAWIMFIVCFVISCGVSTAISVLAEKQENRRLEEALKRYKEED